MKQLIKLTNYEDSGSVYIDPARIIEMRDLPAGVGDFPGMAPLENGRRTYVTTLTGSFLVKESTAEIFALAAAKDKPPGNSEGE